MKTIIFYLLFVFISLASNAKGNYTFYVLSSDENEADPIKLYEFNPETNKLKATAAFSGVHSANYFSISPDQKHLIVTSKSKDNTGAGFVTYSIGEDGVLFKVGEHFYPEEGAFPCHVSFSNNQKYVFGANYTGGKITVADFTNNKLQAISQSIQFEGKGFDPKRQKAPHAHFIKQNLSGEYVYAVDLGTDKIMNYQLLEGQLKENPKQAFLKMHPGAGPRHLAFHPDGTHVYVLNELESSITSCSLNPEDGTLKTLQTVKMLPDTFTGFSKAAAIRVHPTGKFIYGSNRGHHCISVYGLSPDGSFDLIEHEEQNVNWPRDFQLTPDGNFLFCCNMKTDNFSVYKVGENGKLTYLNVSENVSKPLCINFINQN